MEFIASALSDIFIAVVGGIILTVILAKKGLSSSGESVSKKIDQSINIDQSTNINNTYNTYNTQESATSKRPSKRSAKIPSKSNEEAFATVIVILIGVFAITILYSRYHDIISNFLLLAYLPVFILVHNEVKDRYNQKVKWLSYGFLFYIFFLIVSSFYLPDYILEIMNSLNQGSTIEVSFSSSTVPIERALIFFIFRVFSLVIIFAFFTKIIYETIIVKNWRKFYHKDNSYIPFQKRQLDKIANNTNAAYFDCFIIGILLLIGMHMNIFYRLVDYIKALI